MWDSVTLNLERLLPEDPNSIFSRGFVLDVLRALDFHASKLLGQNFLYQRPTLEACLNDAGIADGETILEVGPGLGHLSAALALRGCHVVADRDRQPPVEFCTDVR